MSLSSPARSVSADIVIIGGGIAGAGAAWFLARAGASVIILEAEEVCGYHTTGRSAAFYAESYGGPDVQPLTSASGDFLKHPPVDFAAHGFVSPRGALHVFRPDQRASAQKMADHLSAVGVHMLDVPSARDLAPHIIWDGLAGAVYDPACADLDVAALHQAYLRGVKLMGGRIFTRSAVTKAHLKNHDWHITCAEGSVYVSPKVVLATGAWSDHLAGIFGTQVLGITPMRRTIAVTGNLASTEAHERLPLLFNMQETLYFRPEGLGFLVSPADETPSPAGDCQPGEEDIALAMARFSALTGLAPKYLSSRWAGLRSFAPDRLPVIGAAADREGLYWSAGQGGWGIQTSPAWSALLAQMVLGEAALSAADLAALSISLDGIDQQRYLPARFRPAQSAQAS